MKPNLLFAGISLLASLGAVAQNETTKWYFGAYAGLDFMSGTPVTVASPTMMATENCASIADGNGNLLFYTNSENIWDASHNIMANGAGILGNNSTTQSMILKQPGSTSIYYLFTSDDAGGPDGFRYTTVDMSLAAGMGSVTAKNTPLYTPSCEKITAVRHCNGTDAWVISHEVNTNGFRAFLVTAAGVSLTPVVTNIGSSGGGSFGFMKCSPNGRKLVSVVPIWGSPLYELYDFDNATGVLSNLQTLPIGGTTAGTCEFSPDGTKMYTCLTLSSTIVQWDLCANNATTAIQSQFSGLGNYFGGLQLAPNGKIYVCRASNATLGVINNPNAAGAACNYSDAGVTLAPNGMVQPTCQLGLPAFLPHYFRTPAQNFTYNNSSCQNVFFSPPAMSCSASGASLTGVSWNFGDVASGAANQSTLSTPVHAYSAVGTYTVKLVLYYPCSSDTLQLPVTINSAAPAIALSGPLNICKGQSATYSLSGTGTYSWSSGATGTTAVLAPTVTTSYTITSSDPVSGCTASKGFTINVSACTGIEQWQAAEGKLLVYPNPSNGVVIVETEREGTIQVYNQLGEMVTVQAVSSGKNSLDISRFSSGVYVLKYKNSSGEKICRLIRAD